MGSSAAEGGVDADLAVAGVDGDARVDGVVINGVKGKGVAF